MITTHEYIKLYNMNICIRKAEGDVNCGRDPEFMFSRRLVDYVVRACVLKT